MRQAASFPLLLLCFFLSGFAGLVYETAWTREFAFVFGTSNLAVATVLAAYMGGLAAGAAVAARFAQRIRRPVLAYGLLELGIGVSALGVPFAIRASRSLYVGLFGGQGALPDAGGLPTALFYLATSFLILLLPTAMMGATLPLLARWAVRSEEEIGRRIGMLYAVNTFGAVAGTAIAAFVLLPSLGLRQTIWLAAGVNGLVFMAAWALGRSAGPLPAAPSEAPGGDARPARNRWILALVLGSGMASFTYEVLWVRLLEHVLGGSVYAFATMLASFLAGIALGAAAASRLGRTRERATLGFALAQLGIAALSLAAFIGIDQVPRLTAELVQAGASKTLADVAACMLTLFPAALFVGATYPFAVRALTRDENDAGPASARVYAFNTLGSILGSVGAGFFIIPALGFAGTLQACLALNLALAAGAAWWLAPRRLGLAGVSASAMLLVLSIALPEPWQVLRYSPLTGESEEQLPKVYFGVGRAATVLLLDDAPRYALRTNGLPEAMIYGTGSARNLPVLAHWQGALPTLVRPDARSMMVVGLGGGVALEMIAPSVDRVDVIELEPEVIAANRAVGELRWRDPLKDSRVHLHENDARNAISLSEERFDAIVSQPSHPWSAGASHLYTREFFELVKSRLGEDGVFVQWIGFAFVDEALFGTLLATLGDVFDHVRVYSPPPMGGALFIASDAPLDVETSAGRALAAAPQHFANLSLVVPEDVLAWLLLDERGARAMAKGQPINRDDFNLLQSLSPRLGDRALRGRIATAFAAYDPLPEMELDVEQALYLIGRLPLFRAERLAERLVDPVDRDVGRALVAMGRSEIEKARALLETALQRAPRHVHARAAALQLAMNGLRGGAPPSGVVTEPLNEVERTVVAGWRALGSNDPPALTALDPELADVPRYHPLSRDAARMQAEWRIVSGDPERIAEAVRLSERESWLRGMPADVLLRSRVCLAARDYSAALQGLEHLTRQLVSHPGVARLFTRPALGLLSAIPEMPELAARRTQVAIALAGQQRR